MLHIDCNFYEKLNKKSKSKEKIKSPWEMLFIHVQQAGEASSLFPFFAIEFAEGEFFFSLPLQICTILLFGRNQRLLQGTKEDLWE